MESRLISATATQTEEALDFIADFQGLLPPHHDPKDNMILRMPFAPVLDVRLIRRALQVAVAHLFRSHFDRCTFHFDL